MRAILERHGGTVEKFIGDAVVAAFGIPVAHEDDALRAIERRPRCGSASSVERGVLSASAGVTLAIRIGINTGEVVAGDPSEGHFYASGDAVNVAARLEQAAQPGEILLGEPHTGLFATPMPSTRRAARAQGEVRAVPAYRLVSSSRVPPRSPVASTPLSSAVSKSLLACSSSLSESVAERTPVLVTVLGPAGIGKTRLAAEFTAEIQERATVLQGRCLPTAKGSLFGRLKRSCRSLPDRPAGVPDPEQAGTRGDLLRLPQAL